MVRRTQSRRGVVILIVLSLLVLFVLLVVTFAIVAGQYRRAAQAVGRREWLGEDPQKTADRVMYTLVREPGLDHTGSPFRGHALLTDVYGIPVNRPATGDVVPKTMKGRVWANVTPLAGGQIVQFDFVHLDTSSTGWPVTTNDSLSGFYDGSVLTFLDGPLQGNSARVVAYAEQSTDVYRVRIVNPNNDGTAVQVPAVNNTFLLNGKPFVGTGFGYDSTAASGSPRLTDEALKPNRIGQPIYYPSTPARTDTLIHFVNGGPNESYDAADYQNMILGAVAYDSSISNTRVLPSFHRPELISYWRNLTSSPSATESWGTLDNPSVVPADWTSSANPSHRQFRRKLVFRPMPWDHPNFTGSNQYFDGATRTAQQIEDALTNGWVDLNANAICEPNEVAWDVDNDGDGIKDSIWIDPDLPIQTTEDGRTFRPLVAVHCVDMDGRLNLNAHGNFAHIPGILPVPVPVPLAGGATSAAFPKGQGYGPPEVDLNALINNNAINGPYHLLLRARYGADGLPGRGGYDPLMQFKFYEYPGNYFASVFPRATHFNRYPYPVSAFEGLSAFGSNMDVRGLLACGVDHRGQPLYEGIYTPGPPPSSFLDQLADSPYELNLNSPSAADAPFTVAELEKVLRFRDFDASTLKSRLTDLPNLAFLRDPALGPRNRLAVTTDSYDLPVPGVVAPENYTGTVPPQTIIELLASRLSVANVNAEIAKMLSPDLMMGLRMDINRPLGNGRDDNGNGVVDEAYGVADPNNESSGPEYALNGANPTIPAMVIDHDNDGVISGDSDAYLARHYLARHLYVLLMLLKEQGFQFDFDGDASNNTEETARVLAQWAINAVDFRDADSIMTPFEYDVNPFNGWDVDGILGSADDNHPDRRVVWGCERPELLITETLAFHDVRTEDLKDPGGTKADGHDEEQRLMPRGALFVELYNPWAGHDKWPGEFYGMAPSGEWGVALNRRNRVGHPVWRLAITDRAEPDALDTTNPERAVYFADPAGLIATGGAKLGTRMHYSTVGGIAPLLPGRYAVVGSAGPWSAGAPPSSPYATTIGRRSDATEGGGLNSDKTRQIVLRPNVDPDVNQVEVRNNIDPPVDPAADPITVDEPMDGFSTPPADVQPAIAVPVDAVLAPAGSIKTRTKVRATPPPSTPAGYEVADMSLSISEPLDGYDDTAGFDPALADGEGAFTAPIDTPLDDDRLPPPNTTIGPEDGSYPGYVHLQRLANPLAPYDDNLNPYLTIDVMPVDLTVFNGVTVTGGGGEFGCFERGADDRVDREFWHQPPSTDPSPGVPPPEASAVHVFGYVLRHTLGTLNSTYTPAFGSAGAPIPDIRPWSSSPPSRFYVGAPDTISTARLPFPWLPWNNRPYVSPTELLLVPRSSSSWLLRDFSTCSPAPGPASAYDNPLGRFHHLLNFFHQSDPNLATPNAANLYRVFEYLRVLPKFAGTETLLNPSTTAPHFGSNAAGTEMLHPPFNWISSYREPGRINLNTIYDTRVWNALWGNHTQTCNDRLDNDGDSFIDEPDEGFHEFLDNRRGYGAAGGNLFTASSAVPTYFANPYRATGSAQLVPPVDSDGNGDVTELMRLEVDASLLRTNRSTMGRPTTLAPTDLPRYLNDFTDTTSDVRNISRRSDRNPYFSYQALQRLSNLVTCRSNVYALWLTIGYFEVEGVNAAGQPILGQEIGIDTGTVKRHRAFYIIDRSIPVAFEPGQNHNVDKCVVLRRFIE